MAVRTIKTIQAIDSHLVMRPRRRNFVDFTLEADGSSTGVVMAVVSLMIDLGKLSARSHPGVEEAVEDVGQKVDEDVDQGQNNNGDLYQPEL
ncbi:MAG: hypothetical protein RL119_1755 [Actinomycetota bacterium]